MSGIDRRQFIKLGAGGFVLAAMDAQAMPHPSQAARGRYRFPQGIASADPTPSTVLLWTRVEGVTPAPGPIKLRVQVSERADFRRVTVDRVVEATAASDHTVRALITGLRPDTAYHYRFVAEGDASEHGRTRTAPAPDSERAVRFAVVSCHRYDNGFFGAYRHLLNSEAGAPLDFVLHLGDLIYEYAGAGEAISGARLVDAAGRPRSVPPFPDGAGVKNGTDVAMTLADYRHLYKTYLSDRDFRAVRARYPFVCIWDDHEFTNNGWQSRTVYPRADLPTQRRRVAASQAWFEYVPAMLSELGDTVSPAHDFTFREVTDAPFDATTAADEPNNRAAISALCVYRRLRFGSHVDLILTDTRSYRSEGVPGAALDALPRDLPDFVPVSLVRMFEHGRDHPGGAPANMQIGGKTIVNTHAQTPRASMLGAEQLAWFKGALANSTATWKLWGNSVPSLPLRLDFSRVAPDMPLSTMSTDNWDGYSRELAEIARFAAERKVRGIVSIAGDRHLHLAGVVPADLDAPAAPPAFPEIAVTGVSSPSRFSYLLRLMREKPLRRAALVTPLVADGAKPVLNATLLEHAGGRRGPGLRYVDSDSYGYGVVTAGRDRLDAELRSVQPPDRDFGAAGPKLLRAALFSVARDRPDQLQGPRFRGAPPHPFDATPEQGSNP